MLASQGLMLSVKSWSACAGPLLSSRIPRRSRVVRPSVSGVWVGSLGGWQWCGPQGVRTTPSCQQVGWALGRRACSCPSPGAPRCPGPGPPLPTVWCAGGCRSCLRQEGPPCPASRVRARDACLGPAHRGFRSRHCEPRPGPGACWPEGAAGRDSPQPGFRSASVDLFWLLGSGLGPALHWGLGRCPVGGEGGTPPLFPEGGSGVGGSPMLLTLNTEDLSPDPDPSVVLGDAKASCPRWGCGDPWKGKRRCPPCPTAAQSRMESCQGPRHGAALLGASQGTGELWVWVATMAHTRFGCIHWPQGLFGTSKQNTPEINLAHT